MERLPVDVTLNQRQNHECTAGERKQCCCIATRAWDPECCLHLPSCKQDNWTSHSDWLCHTAISMTRSQCQRPALPEHKFFLFCFVLCFWQTTARLTLQSYHQPGQWESILCLFAEAELSLGGLLRVCVLVFFFRSSPVGRAGRRQAYVPQPETNCCCVQQCREKRDLAGRSAIWIDRH